MRLDWVGGQQKPDNELCRSIMWIDGAKRTYNGLKRAQRYIEESEGEMASLKTNVSTGRLGGKEKWIMLNSIKGNSQQNWGCRKMWIGECDTVSNALKSVNGYLGCAERS